mmetsp:Transcript_5875/g.10466  ORF Transcript_5875/g.10466 Transcript_5875/m.10466 type:complete len:222 (+) Transcript_5875:1105-1770(+)
MFRLCKPNCGCCRKNAMTSRAASSKAAPVKRSAGSSSSSLSSCICASSSNSASADGSGLLDLSTSGSLCHGFVFLCFSLASLFISAISWSFFSVFSTISLLCLCICNRLVRSASSSSRAKFCPGFSKSTAWRISHSLLFTKKSRCSPRFSGSSRTVSRSSRRRFSTAKATLATSSSKVSSIDRGSSMWASQAFSTQRAFDHLNSCVNSSSAAEEDKWKHNG